MIVDTHKYIVPILRNTRITRGALNGIRNTVCHPPVEKFDKESVQPHSVDLRFPIRGFEFKYE